MSYRSTEARFSAVLNQPNDAVFILDPNGHCAALNQRAADLLFVDPASLTGQSLLVAIPQSDHTRWQNDLRRLREGEYIGLSEWVFQRTDRVRVPVEVNAYWIDESPPAIVVIARDIHERKHIERNMTEQVGILQQVTDAIIVTDMGGIILSWNRAAENIYGWAAEDVLGRKLSDIAPMVENEYSEALLKEQYLVRGHWQSEISQYRRDGRVLHISSSVSLVKDEHGMPVALVTVNHDITKRKEAEIAAQRYADHMAALRQIDAEINSTLEIEQVLHLALNAAVLLAGADAGFVLVNDTDGQPRLMHAYGPYDSPRYRESQSPLYGIAARVMNTLQAEIVPDVTQDPDYIADIPATVAVMTFPLVSGERVVGTIHLETARQNHFTLEIAQLLNLLVNRLATAIENARLYKLTQDQVERLQTLEQIKTDMIRIASHDLRNPVGLIHGFLEILRMDTTDRLNEEELDYIDTMQRAVSRMQHIIDDLLSLERIREITTRQLSEVVDLAQMVQTVVADHQAEAAARRQQLTLAIKGDDFCVNADATQIREAAANLVSNALKYTPDGGRIQVRLQQSDGYVGFRVQDTGVGIAEEYHARLFQPFYRVKTVETQGIEGTGLGLHLVKNIVDRHRGHMVFTSSPGKGSTFGFDLPLVEPT